MAETPTASARTSAASERALVTTVSRRAIVASSSLLRSSRVSVLAVDLGGALVEALLLELREAERREQRDDLGDDEGGVDRALDEHGGERRVAGKTSCGNSSATPAWCTTM